MGELGVFQEIAAVLSLLKDAVDFLKKAPPESIDRSMRKALREIYFSDATIERIKTIRDAKDEKERERAAGQIATTQGYDRADVHAALGTLASLARKKEVSVRANKLLEQIIFGKMNIRRSLAEALHRYKNSDREALDGLLNEIEALNSAIIEVDDRLGGTVLGAKQNG